jgi:hypothetical protein
MEHFHQQFFVPSSALGTGQLDGLLTDSRISFGHHVRLLSSRTFRSGAPQRVKEKLPTPLSGYMMVPSPGMGPNHYLRQEATPLGAGAVGNGPRRL